MIEGGFHEEQVKIQCPHCEGICNAEVKWWDNFPFASYVHECEYCGYMITESEFNVINQ